MLFNFSQEWNDNGGQLFWSNSRQVWMLTETKNSPVFEINIYQMDALQRTIEIAQKEYDNAHRRK